MSMNPEEQNFEQLRRLLVLKRHEQPPPGYFHLFSREVIFRIRAGDGAGEQGAFGGRFAWLQNLWVVFEQKPVLASSFGLAVCGLLVWAVAFADTSPGTVDVPGSSVPRLLAVVPDHPAGLQISERSEAERRFLAGFSSTNGGILPQASRGSLFNEMTPLHAQPASWHVPGN